MVRQFAAARIVDGGWRIVWERHGASNSLIFLVIYHPTSTIQHSALCAVFLLPLLPTPTLQRGRQKVRVRVKRLGVGNSLSFLNHSPSTIHHPLFTIHYPRGGTPHLLSLSLAFYSTFSPLPLRSASTLSELAFSPRIRYFSLWTG